MCNVEMNKNVHNLTQDSFIIAAKEMLDPLIWYYIRKNNSLEIRVQLLSEIFVCRCLTMVFRSFRSFLETS